MANNPLVNATVKITAKDINGNNVAKQFNSVLSINFDYSFGANATVNVIDTTGSFYFPLGPLTTVTYTITTGAGGQHAVVMS